ncbi:UNVERIFIED_CONTAM: ABC transporter G family member 53 [Sesamum radiatum]|uniref:ABC transporter G family member 53 n=1 Tax=Sesamum radiatum TaxID=300843 RepID=A0AAW2PHQ3_SESRA
MSRNSVQDIFNCIGSMYASVLFLGIQNYVSVQPVVSVERTVFYRERAAGMYSSLPYAIAQVAIEFPYIFAQAAVYGSIVYVMIGFERTAVKFFWYIFFMYLTLSYFTFYGMMTRIPLWWRWYCWACPVAWTLYGLAASQLGDVEEYISPEYTVKEFLRRYFGFRHDFLGVVAGMHVAFVVVFILTFGFAIRVFNFERR